MRVQAQVEISAEELNYLPLEYVRADVQTLFAKECVKNLWITEHPGFTPGSKIFALDAFLLNQEDYTKIAYKLQDLEFLAATEFENKLISDIAKLLRK